MNRRDFIQRAAAGFAFPVFASKAARPAHKQSKRVALIGPGWYGKCDLLRLIQVSPVEVAALCDVDGRMLSQAADIVSKRQKSGKKPRMYRDYRKLIEKEDLDFVLIDTPDHWHALPMIEAVQNGLDVFVQKPISVDVVEAQAMREAARKYKRVVQVGMQRRSTPHLMDALERIIKPGKLGRIGHVEVYCYYHMRARGNPPATEPPGYLDYEMWTGPAPMRPYNRIRHPRSWRAFMEYSNGIVGDMCIHMFDMIRWMLNLAWPERISSTGGIQVDKESIATISDTQNAAFDYGGLQVVWQHRTWGHAVDGDYPWGATIYGDKGTLRLSVHRYDFKPRGGGKPVHKDVVYELEKYPEDKTEKGLERHVAPAIRTHMLDFLKAIEKRSQPVAGIEEGYISTTSCILANLACRLGRTLHWDPEKGCVKDDDEANRLLRRPYRKPWVHPDPKTV